MTNEVLWQRALVVGMYGLFGKSEAVLISRWRAPRFCSRLIMPILLVLSLAVASRAVAATETVDGITWTYTTYAGSAYVMSVDIPFEGEVVIPSLLGGCPVKEIGSAFAGCTNRISVVIPDGVTSIEGFAFEDCSGLVSVVIPKSVTRIDYYAFSGCSSLRSVTIPNGVEKIQYSTFAGCSSLMAASIPTSVRQIERDAFSHCSSLTSIKIPDGVTEIQEYAFCGCDSLRSIDIPTSVTNIESMAFSGCALESVEIPDGVVAMAGNAFLGCDLLKNLRIPASMMNIDGVFQVGHSLLSIDVDPGNKRYKSVDGVLYDCETKTLMCCSRGKMGVVVIPDGIEHIQTFNNAFVTEIVMPSSVVSIDKGAFSGCKNLRSLTIPIAVKSLESILGDLCYDIAYVTLCETFTEVDDLLFSRCYGLQEVAIPPYVKISAKAFDSCKDVRVVPSMKTAMLTNNNDRLSVIYPHDAHSLLTNVTIGVGVTAIYRPMFEGCTSLKELTVPEGVGIIDTFAFSGCSSLERINLPSSVTNIGAYAFDGCQSLKSIKVPSGVKSLGAYAFNGCSSLTEVDLPEETTAFEQGIFCNCTSLTSFEFPPQVTGLAPSLFSGCSSLSHIELPDGTTEIPALAFSGCTSLQTLEIPSTVTKIMRSAFSLCSGLVSINLPTQLTELGEEAFMGCRSLEEVALPSGIKLVSDGLFAGCVSLSRLHLPESLTAIGDAAFQNCTALQTVKIPYGVTRIQTPGASWITASFDGCDGIRSVTAPLSEIIVGQLRYSFPASYQMLTNVVVTGWTPYSGISFVGCRELASISVTDGNQSCCSVDGVLYDKAHKNLICCPAKRRGALYLPASVSSIGDFALDACDETSSIDVDEGNPSYSSFDGVLYDKRFLTLIRCPGGKTGVVNIPDGVVSVASGAFAGCSRITSVTLPGGVREVQDEMFKNCLSLQSVTIEGDVRYVGKEAFSGCRKLESVCFCGTAGDIGEYAFEGCESLRRLVIPEGVKSLGRGWGNAGLESVYLSSTVTSIGYIGTAVAPTFRIEVSPFNETYGVLGDVLYNKKTQKIVQWLASSDAVVIPEGICQDAGVLASPYCGARSVSFPSSYEFSAIAASDFSGCDELETIQVSSDNPNYCSIDGVLYDKDVRNLLVCPRARRTPVEIPETVTNIARNAFGNCRLLPSIEIRSNVKSIEPYAFSSCPALSSISITNDVAVDEFAFNGCTGIREVVVGNSGLVLNSLFRKVVVPCVDSISNLFPSAFAELTTISFCEGVTNLSIRTLSGCESLRTLQLPSSLTRIRDSECVGCRQLRSVTLPGNVEDYGRFTWVFDSYGRPLMPTVQLATLLPDAYADITNVVICEKTEKIAPRLCDGCSALLSISIPVEVQEIGYGAFCDCSQLSHILLPGQLKTIGDGAFLGCESLQSVMIPSNVVNVGVAAFEGCASLLSIAVDVGNQRFASDTGILYDVIDHSLIACPCGVAGRIEVRSDTKVISERAFAGCGLLTAVGLPYGLQDISDEAFAGCSAIRSLTIPASVELVGERAFSGCSTLEKVVYKGDAPLGSRSDSSYHWDEPRDIYEDTPTSLVTSVAYDSHGWYGDSGRVLPYTWPTYDGENSRRIVHENQLASLTILGKDILTGGQTAVYLCMAEFDGGQSNVVAATWRLSKESEIANVNSAGCLSTALVDNKKQIEIEASFVLNGVEKNVRKVVTVEPAPVEFSGVTIEGEDFILSGDSAAFSCVALYRGAGLQHDEPQTKIVSPIWTASAGKMDANGEFVAPVVSEKTIVMISAEYTEAGVTRSTSLTVVIWPKNTPPDPPNPPNPPTPSEEGWRYAQTIEGIVVTGFVPEPTGKLVIPAQLDGLPVVAIGSGAFKDCREMTEVVIPNTVKSIGSEAFSYSGLVAVTIPDYVETIGSHAFGCSFNLSSVQLGENVKSIGDEAFWGTCIGRLDFPVTTTSIGRRLVNNQEFTVLTVASGNGAYASKDGVLYDGKFEKLVLCPPGKTNVSIPSTVIEIGDSAFLYSSITALNLPTGLLRIGDSAFWGCSAGRIVVPEAVAEIGAEAFNGGFLESIEVDSANEFYASVDGALYDKTITTLLCCPRNKKSLVIPSTVVRIGDCAVHGNGHIRSLVLPDSIEMIGEEAFDECEKLEEVVFGSGLKTIGSRAFCSCVALRAVRFGANLKMIGNQAFVYTALESVRLPDSVENVEYGAFRDCAHLEEVVFGKGIRTIGDAYSGVFDGCTALSAVYFTGDSPLECASIYLGTPESLITYVPVGSIGWNVTADDATLPVKWPTSGSARRAIRFGSPAVDPTQPMVYTISYVLNGGANAPSNPLSYTTNDLPIALAAPTREGCEFTGWTLDGVIVTQIEKGMTGSVLLTANWFEPGLTDRTGRMAVVEDFKYTYWINQGTAVITAIENAEGRLATALRIPSTLGGYAVSEIGYMVMADDLAVVDVVLPDSLKILGDGAFACYHILSHVTLNEGLESIGVHAFWSTAVNELTVPSSVKDLEEGCFAGAFYGGGHAPVAIDSGNTGYVVVDGCVYNADRTMLLFCPPTHDSIDILDSVEIIAGAALDDCPLQTLAIGRNVREIRELSSVRGPLIDTYTLGRVEVAEGNLNYSSYAGVLYNKEMTELIFCPLAAVELTLPKTVVELDSWLLSYNSYMEWYAVEEGNQMYEAYDGCLYDKGCRNLLAIAQGREGNIALPASMVGPTDISGFMRLAKFDSFTVEDGNAYFESHDGSLYDKGRRTLIFASTAFTEFFVDEPVERIGSYAFSCHWGLTKLTCADSVKSIGVRAFECTALEEVDLGQGLKRVEDYAFDACDFSRIVFPPSLSYLGDKVFDRCSALKGIYFQGNAPEIGSLGADRSFTFGDENVSQALTVYVVKGSTGWDGTQGSAMLPREWPVGEMGRRPLVTWDGVSRSIYLYPLCVEADFSAVAANTYDGYVLDEDYNLVAIVQVKTAKQTVKKTTDRVTKSVTVTTNITATATVTDANGKKWSYSKGVVTVDGVVSGLKCTTKDCPVSEFGVALGKNGMEGAWGEYAIFGARNGMGTKDDEMMAALEAYKGKWSVTIAAARPEVAPCQAGESSTLRLQLNVQAKGVVKIAGSWESGEKVSASAQMVMGDGFAYVPVMVKATKTTPALTALFRIEGEMVELVSGRAVDPSGVSRLMSLVGGGRTVEELGEPVYLPSEVSAGGAAFSARVAVDELAYPAKFAAKGLPAGLKINAATGVISGTPTKPGSYTATVTVTSGANSSVKKTVSVPFTIENYVDPKIRIEDAYGPYYVGVSMNTNIVEAADTKASGLPSGLKWSTKNLTDKNIGAVPAWSVYGVPTKTCTNTVYFKKSVKETVDGKQKTVTHQASATFRVEGMRPWAVGTFDGGNTNGMVTLTVSNVGKISGKWMSGGTNWTLSAASFDAYISSEQMYVATVIGKSGKLAMTNEIEVTESGIAGYVTSGKDSACPFWAAWRNVWKEDPLKALAKKLKGQKRQVGEVLLTVGASGAVTAKGTFVTGFDEKRQKYISYSASCSTALIPTAETGLYRVYLYFPPKSGKFDGFSDVVEIVLDVNQL